MLDVHNQHVRFLLPEPVLAIPAEQRAARTWETEVMMQVEGVGAFVRALLPVHLDGGHRLTYGLWLGVRPADMHRALDQWWAPTYPDLVLDGAIANHVLPWDVLSKPARAVVRDPNETPYLDTSSDDEVTRVLNDIWSHDYVMNALPESLRGTA
jgi:hypothetical protein